jgi:hypothetical protein
VAIAIGRQSIVVFKGSWSFTHVKEGKKAIINLKSFAPTGRQTFIPTKHQNYKGQKREKNVAKVS